MEQDVGFCKNFENYRQLDIFYLDKVCSCTTDSKADTNNIKSSSQSDGTCERLAEAMIFDANLSDCAYVLLMVEEQREIFDPSIQTSTRKRLHV